jgi:AAA domain
MTAYDRVLDALRDHGSTVKANGGRKAIAQCPAHEDRKPSLAVTGIEGRALLHCHAGCDKADVLAALKLTLADLFDDTRGAAYRYDNGRTVVRTPDKRFRQVGTEHPPELYRLAKVKTAVAAGQTIYVVEGEQDVQAIESLGGVATCSPMGAGKWSKVDPSPLYGAAIVIVADQDEAGRKHAADVRASLDGHATVSVVTAKGGGCKDAADHIAAGHGLDDFEPLEDGTDLARRLFPRTDWHALWADDSDEEWLHVPLLPARRSIVIYSPPKAGKSLLMLEFAVALSRGKTFLGHQIERRIRVLYVDFENDPRGDVRSRLQAMGYGPDDLDHLDHLSYPTMAGLDTERGSLELLEAVRAYRSEVVIIDTVSRAVDGEENSNDTWLGLYRHTGLKLKQAGVALVRLDHTGKDETRGTRGGSAKSGDVDAIWRLSKITDERFRLECTDSRMLIETKSLHLTRHRLPRLHHTADVLGAMTDREARIANLVQLLDANGIPADATREAVRAFAAGRGIKARTDVFADVVKRRKIVPELGDSASAGSAENGATLAGTSGTAQAEQPPVEHETAPLSVPKPPGTVGDNESASPVPGAQLHRSAPWGQRDNIVRRVIAGKPSWVNLTTGDVLDEDPS